MKKKNKNQFFQQFFVSFLFSFELFGVYYITLLGWYYSISLVIWFLDRLHTYTNATVIICRIHFNREERASAWSMRFITPYQTAIGCCLATETTYQCSFVANVTSCNISFSIETYLSLFAVLTICLRLVASNFSIGVDDYIHF